MKDIDNVFAELRGSEPYLADAGFTDVVMAQLPTNRELPFWLKNLILLAAAALGSIMVAMQLPTGGNLVSTLLSVASLPALDMKLLAAMAVNNLPIILIASVAFGYLMPYGTYLAVRRGAL